MPWLAQISTNEKNSLPHVGSLHANFSSDRSNSATVQAAAIFLGDPMAPIFFQVLNIHIHSAPSVGKVQMSRNQLPAPGLCQPIVPWTGQIQQLGMLSPFYLVVGADNCCLPWPRPGHSEAAWGVAFSTRWPFRGNRPCIHQTASSTHRGEGG